MSRLVEQYQIASSVIGLHAEGKTIRRALREVKYPNGTTMTRQLFETLCAEDEELRKLRVAAARCFRESYHDLLLNIDDDPEEGRTDAKMAAVISANIKHVLAVDDPDKFGNRVKVEHNISASESIVRALEAARHRAGLGLVLDVVAEVVAEAAEGITQTLPPPTSYAAVMPPGALDDPFAALAAIAGQPGANGEGS